MQMSFSHIGLFVTDLPKMVEFYTRILGLYRTATYATTARRSRS